MNTSSLATHIGSVAVEVPGSNQVLATYSGSQVTAIMTVGHAPTSSPSLGPAESGQLFLDVSLAADQPLPKTLDHRFQISFTPADGHGGDQPGITGRCPDDCRSKARSRHRTADDRARAGRPQRLLRRQCAYPGSADD